VIRAVGVETGGSNIQFAVNPENGDMVVVEMNPRVSRSSALASKATGFPIAKIAAKLAVGYTLDELPNDITGTTSACFEPTIDYVVVKMPRWTFEKFPETDETLTTQMKSVGEAMAIGRTFKEALQKAIRSMEVGRFGLGLDSHDKSLAIHASPDRQGGVSDGRPEPLAHAQGSQPEYPIAEEKLNRKLAVPSQGRLYYVRYALKMGWSVEKVHELSRIDPWFLEQIAELAESEHYMAKVSRGLERDGDTFRLSDLLEFEEARGDWDITEMYKSVKGRGYSDVQIGLALGKHPLLIRNWRHMFGHTDVTTHASYKLVDTCAAEFEAKTPYYYSTYELPFKTLPLPEPRKPSNESAFDDEIRVTDRPKVIIIGGGPNRIGQGIEFDYCCCQAAFAVKELGGGVESVMINSNPETVSTDYDTSDLLFFEPLTHEDVLNICERLNGGPFGRSHASPDREGGVSDSRSEPLVHAQGSRELVKGVVVQFGGQTPLNLAKGLEEAGVPILGTSVDAIHRAGSREQFRDLIQQLGLKQPANGIARSVEEAKAIANDVGYPVLVRPSFVLGGRAMEIVYDEAALDRYMTSALDAAGLTGIADSPILVDKFLDGATEVDVDCVADYRVREEGVRMREEGRSVIAGVMEHIEEAGIHSGDSACVLPPHSLSANVVAELKSQTHELAKALQVRGLMNVQYAVKDGEVFVIEVNPRASRTVPFVGKATGVNWARIAAKVMMGQSLDELGVEETPPFDHVAVKEAVFPFAKFPGTDIILGPEMKSTGEVMGIDANFPLAYAKAIMAEGSKLPDGGTLFVSVRPDDHDAVVPIARKFAELGFKLIATKGTLDTLTQAGVEATLVNKIAEHVRPNLLDLVANGEVDLIVNTPTRKGAGTDEAKIRAAAFRARVPIVTTLTAADAWAGAIRALRETDWQVTPLQAWHGAAVAAD
ncbi:MAG: carbamoyl-phosphate synthase large subunit, partial [Planctomycetota bacterium]